MLIFSAWYGLPRGMLQQHVGDCFSQQTSCLLVRHMLTASCGPLQVNSQLQTSNPDVYAVGDIAAFPLTLYGDQLNRQEHVANARWAG